MNRFAKTILCCYNAIPTMVKKVDRLVYSKAVKSHSNSYGHGNTLYQMDRIVSLLNVKNDLLLMRKITDKALACLPVKQRVLIVSKFFHNMTCEQIQQAVNVSMRTLFRQINASVNSFASALIIEGYDREWFISTYLSERWIKHIYNTCCEKQGLCVQLPQEQSILESA
ncbi:MAG: hypothetical protein PHW00_02710 [Clostridia bacterium]|nr:hypothetical protein [Clostridia bacterium]